MNNGTKIGLSNVEIMVDGKYVPLARGGVVEATLLPTEEEIHKYCPIGHNDIECVVPLKTIKKIYRRTPKGKKIYKLKILNPILKMIQDEIYKKIHFMVVKDDK